MSKFRRLAISAYWEINKILGKMWRKLEYIWSHRYIWIKNMQIKNILDVWASRWQSVERRSSLLWNDINFYCFEPLKTPFSIISNKYSDHKNVNIYNHALWNENNSKDMYVSNMDDSSSLLAPTSVMTDTYQQIHFDNNESIQIKKLDDIFVGLKVVWNTLMKVDTQWFEGMVFEWWEQTLRKNVNIIVVELSFEEFYKDQPLFDDIVKQLNGYGFRYYGSFEQSANPTDGKPLQQDAYFVNTNL